MALSRKVCTCQLAIRYSLIPRVARPPACTATKPTPAGKTERRHKDQSSKRGWAKTEWAGLRSCRLRCATSTPELDTPRAVTNGYWKMHFHIDGA